jgi:signal transduction histidine kinase/ligand-binding sensor domain-containing protein
LFCVPIPKYYDSAEVSKAVFKIDILSVTPKRVGVALGYILQAAGLVIAVSLLGGVPPDNSELDSPVTRGSQPRSNRPPPPPPRSGNPPRETDDGAPPKGRRSGPPPTRPERPPPPPKRDVSRFLAENLVDKWSTDDGLPQSSVLSMAQTPDGYLWLATFAGLVRFDGLRFTVFDAGNTPELVSSRIVYLKVDRRGALWIRSEYGDLSRLEDGRFTRFTVEDGLPSSGHVGVFTEDKEGSFWLPGGRDQGILRLENGKFVVRIPTTSANNRGFQGLLATEDGKLWGTEGNILTRLWPGEMADFVLDADRPEAVVKSSEASPARALPIDFLQSSRDGGIWVASPDGVRKFRGNRWQTTWLSAVMPRAVSGFYEDRTGNVWLGTWGDGLIQFDTRGEVHKYKVTDSPSHEPVRSFFEDREGNFWIGTDGAGLFRVRPRIFRTYGITDGLNARIVKSVSQGPDGTVWMLNQGRIHWLQEHSTSRVEAIPSDIPGAWCNLVDRHGVAWVGTLGAGVFRYRDGSWFHYPSKQTVFALFQDRSSSVWVGYEDGLARVEGDTLREIPAPAGLKTMDVRALADDSAGHLYVGLNGGGLLRSAGGEWTRLSKSDGLSDERVWSLHVDGEDTVWIGNYDKGLSRLKGGRVFNFTGPSLRLPRLIGSILEDNHGHLWLSSNRGIDRVAKKELNDYADGRIDAINTIHYTLRDGLATSECMSGVQPVAWKGTDGRLWFATVAGVAAVDPARMPLNAVPPPVAIEEVLMDDVATVKNATGVTIPPGKHRLEFHFTALSLTAPEKLRFKYQLENFDQEWVDAGTRRSAHFTAVAPGRYRFRVKGCNNDGVWSESTATLGVVVLPHYWQTEWFRASALALLSGLGLLGYHRRISTLKRERAAQEEFSRRLIVSQEQERKRISAELHDGLGQSLLLIRNRAILGRDHSPAALPADAPAQFEAISEAALQAINEVRSIAYALRPYELDRLGLTKALESIAQRAATAGGFRTELDLDLIDDLLPPEFEINLYRIVQEAVTNAVKYAQAKTLTLTLKSQEDSLRLTIRDDGRGFALASGLPDPSVKGGLGLDGISERARIMSGEANFESSPGQGTTLTLIIPLPNRERN